MVLLTITPLDKPHNVPCNEDTGVSVTLGLFMHDCSGVFPVVATVVVVVVVRVLEVSQ